MYADVVGACELSRALPMPSGPCVCAGSVPSVLVGGAFWRYIHSFIHSIIQRARWASAVGLSVFWRARWAVVFLGSKTVARDTTGGSWHAGGQYSIVFLFGRLLRPLEEVHAAARSVARDCFRTQKHYGPPGSPKNTKAHRARPPRSLND
jgi:hypothetical protein